MYIERVFTTLESPDATRTRIAAYLAQIGYEATSPGAVLRYQRDPGQGTAAGPPPQAGRAKVAVEVRLGYDQRTWVCAACTVQLGALASKDPTFWQQEMDALVANAGGTQADMRTTDAQAHAPAFLLHQAASADAGAQVDRQVKSGANWFFWIAGMSIINSVAYRLGLEITFLIGLVGTIFIEGFGIGLSQEWPNSAGLILGVTLVAEILVAGIFVVIGLLARQGLRWVFILGLILYAVDGIIWLAFGDWLPAVFHLLGLFGIFGGLRALGQRR